MGWLPLAAVAAAAAPRVVNTLTHAPGLSSLAKWAGGVDRRRTIPSFADETFVSWFRGRRGDGGTGERGEVVLWPDTFTNHFHPAVGRAAVDVLESAGWRVVVPDQRLCCGLTWISTGQLGVAARVLRRTVSALAPHVRSGALVLGLEPSCTAVFRGDARELLGYDEDVERLRRQTVTLAELLHAHTPGWDPPRWSGTVHVQTHCHQHAILGTEHDHELLKRMGVDLDVVDSGCCGLAGNFGFERGHYDVSEACAERALLPAVRAAAPSDVILADGFSCRTQLEQSDSGGRRGIHLAQLLHSAAFGRSRTV
jgi:Fe-S oxidoreductase